MSETLDRVRGLVARGEVRVSLHGYEELAADNISVRDIVDGLAAAVLVEDYPHYGKGAGREAPAVVVTAYRPDAAKWDETWQRRRP